MQTFNLHIEKELQGAFTLKDINVVLVFQVNCPGCFSYALPLFNKLYHRFNQDNISLLGLSTAFEDFDKNTMAHTESLIKTGELIGETKQFMNQRNIDILPYTLDFPIAMDLIEDKIGRIDLAVDAICTLNPNFKIWPEFEKTKLRQQIISYLNRLEKVPLTFTLNQLQGTPSFIVFNKAYEVLFHTFGHIEYEEIANKIAQFNSDYEL